MPKIVDHDARRKEIVKAVCGIIAADGIDAVTTRYIADKTGYSNGSLLYYFKNKEAALLAAFEYIYDATNERVANVSEERRGLSGLRILCLEIMPLDEERLDESRIALSFWRQALHAPEFSNVNARLMNRWREEISRRIVEAISDGEADVADVPATVDELLSMLMGLQVLALLSPAETTPAHQLAQLDAFMNRLRVRESA